MARVQMGSLGNQTFSGIEFYTFYTGACVVTQLFILREHLQKLSHENKQVKSLQNHQSITSKIQTVSCLL